ncbi:protein FAM169B-like isoform X2 [Pleurodeles waltl]|uniref:protein FAM169B-like isoform X2 n=1 Tax=Pleurodeles waltl TaxID=8319 RepID=UPI00370992F7
MHCSGGLSSKSEKPHSVDKMASTFQEDSYPMDILAESDSELFWEMTKRYYSSLLQQSPSSHEFFSTTDGKQVKIGISSVSRIPLYRDDSEHSILVLMNPQCKETGLAVYLNKSWWPIEDILKTSNSLKDGLIPVQSFGERVVLFVLNCFIFGALEKGAEDEDAAFFVPHSSREDAKIFWQNGEAVAFYTVKPKGCLCDVSTSQCYLLPVLDTAFVRRSHRRRGLMTMMLQDFCQRFSAYDALGISYPLSSAMFRVCQKFLQSHPEEQDRLWEVEAPGDWSQRENIWLQIQLRQRMSVRINQTNRNNFGGGMDIGHTKKEGAWTKKKRL